MVRTYLLNGFFFSFFPQGGNTRLREAHWQSNKKGKKNQNSLMDSDQIKVKKIQLILSMDCHPLLHPGTSTKHKGTSFRRM